MRSDGNLAVMSLRRTVLALLVLIGLIAPGDGEYTHGGYSHTTPVVCLFNSIGERARERERARGEALIMAQLAIYSLLANVNAKVCFVCLLHRSLVLSFALTHCFFASLINPYPVCSGLNLCN